jgi:hypothetical protein
MDRRTGGGSADKMAVQKVLWRAFRRDNLSAARKVRAWAIEKDELTDSWMAASRAARKAMPTALETAGPSGTC